MEIRSYQDAKVFLESLIRPLGRITSDSGPVVTPLERMRVLLEKLGNPEKRFRSVVVTGTAGKGSTAYLLSHLLTRAGYKIGLTISPHLQRLNERIQISGVQILDREFIALVNEAQVVVQEMEKTVFGAPSYYEVLTGMAFVYFLRMEVDLAVVEVGMEGKYDASNLLFPLGVIMTNISLDHTDILGETVEEIAGEAISAFDHLTSGSFVISGVRQQRLKNSVERKCLEIGARLFTLGKDFSIHVKESVLSGSAFDFRFGDSILEDVFLSLLGEYQVENASLVLAALALLKEFGFSVSEVVMREALADAFFAGRFEVVEYFYKGKLYTVILDGAHNEVKMRSFIQALSSFYINRKKIFLVGLNKYKRLESLLPIISVADVIVVSKFRSANDMARHAALDVEKMVEVVQNLIELDSRLRGNDKERGNDKHKVPVFAERDSQSGFLRGLSLVESNELVVVTGSLYLVGEVREFLSRNQ